MLPVRTRVRAVKRLSLLKSVNTSNSMISTTNSPDKSATAASPRLRFLRLSLVVTGIIATLIAVFYTVENWRGKRAWEKQWTELKAKGVAMDWAEFIPAPIPDDQNFFKAPKMEEWF